MHMQKKITVVTSFLALLLFFLLQTNYLTHQFCLVASTCSGVFKLAKLLTLISIAVFPLSVLAVFLKNEASNVWRSFTLMYLVGYFVAIAAAPSSGADYIKIEKGTVAIGMVVLYVAISLVLIAYKSYKLKGK